MPTTDALRLVRVLAWGAVAGIVAGVAFLYLGYLRDGGGQLPGAARMGGSFALTTQAGQAFDSKSLAGRPYAIFFGFTNCPDVCPTTLLEMSNHLQALGGDADRLAVLFVSIDPERDTPEHLKAYLEPFDRRITGLTGNTAEIASVAHTYRAFYEKVPTSTGYTMNHTATVYLFDARGALASTMSYQEPEAVQRDKLRRLLARDGDRKRP